MTAHDIQHEVLKDISASPFVGLVADGTTDLSSKEHRT